MNNLKGVPEMLRLQRTWRSFAERKRDVLRRMQLKVCLIYLKSLMNMKALLKASHFS